MLLQFVTVLQGVLAPALLVMALSVMLTVGEGRDKPLSAYWRLAGFVVGFAGAVVFAALRATAVITQRTFVNYPTLWCCVILDVAVFVIVLFARRITADWHNHRALLDIANLVAALAIAATTFRALPDVILRLTIFVEPGDPIFTSDMLLRALGFALGAAVAIIAALIFRTMRSTAVRWSFTTAVLLLVALLFAQHFTDLAQILQSKRIVSFPTAAFLALVWGINHQRSLTIAMALVFAIPAIASIVMGFKVKPTGANEAIARTHIAFRRRAKAAGAFSLVAMICVTVCLSATVSVAMLGVVFDVGDKLNAELSTYGSNIVVQPQSDAVVSDLYNTGDSAGSASGSSSGSDGGSTSDGSAAADSADPTAFLKESDAQKIKTIFWAFNITNFAPELNIHADAGCVGSGAGSAGSAGTAGASGAAASAAKCKATNVPIVGTWFAKTLHMDSGESTVAGMNGMRSWWKINGTWPKDDSEQAMVGSALAAKLGVNVGDSVTLDKTIAVGADDNTNGGTGKTGKSSTERNRVKVKIVGIFDSGDSDNSAIYMPSIAAQTLANLPNSIDKIEVKALTTPDNDLARKASKNPNALTQDEWETWYCTAYPSSIAYQIEEVLPGAVAKQVRQVAALQGDVLNKTQAVMVLMTVLSLVAAAIAVANLMAASIGERGSELALLKAIGATDGAVSRLMLAETAVISLVGAIAGALLGSGVAQIVGHVVFGSGITMRPMVFVLVFVLLAVTVLVASLSSIRAILGLRPAEVLHGR